MTPASRCWAAGLEAEHGARGRLEEQQGDDLVAQEVGAAQRATEVIHLVSDGEQAGHALGRQLTHGEEVRQREHATHSAAISFPDVGRFGEMIRPRTEQDKTTQGVTSSRPSGLALPVVAAAR